MRGGVGPLADTAAFPCRQEKAFPPPEMCPPDTQNVLYVSDLSTI